jgi:hypothetical protein
VPLGHDTPKPAYVPLPYYAMPPPQ